MSLIEIIILIFVIVVYPVILVTVYHNLNQRKNKK